MSIRKAPDEPEPSANTQGEGGRPARIRCDHDFPEYHPATEDSLMFTLEETVDDHLESVAVIIADITVDDSWIQIDREHAVDAVDWQ